MAANSSIFKNIQTGKGNLGPILEQKIRQRGMTIGKKPQKIQTGYANVPTSVELLKGKGAVVKTIRLNHVSE